MVNDESSLLRALDAELERRASERSTRASESALRYARQLVVAGDGPSRAELARLVVDGWDLTAELADRLVRYAHSDEA